jgi:hypothetical protein
MTDRQLMRCATVVLLAGMIASTAAMGAMSPLGQVGAGQTDGQSKPDPVHSPATEQILDWVDDQPWCSEPAWLRQPAVDLYTNPLPETRPEPIPLPPAVMAGPIVLTTLLAGATMKKRRRSARRW